MDRHSKELENLLLSGTKELDIEVDNEQINKFFKYLYELKEWNKKFNLTAITDEKEIITKHFIDSLLLLKAFKFRKESVLDIGTGAGFPGIPLKIVIPDIKLTLLESSKKKTEFLAHLKNVLNISDTDIITARAEDAGRERRGFFDACVSRAVAPLNVLLEYALPLLKISGKFLALKEENVADEVQNSENAVSLLGGELKDILKVMLPGTNITRSIIITEKTSPTPDKYPRRPGMPKKRPL